MVYQAGRGWVFSEIPEEEHFNSSLINLQVKELTNNEAAIKPEKKVRKASKTKKKNPATPALQKFQILHPVLQKVKNQKSPLPT